ncbi:MAG TPA: hypothetical protein PKJ68_06640 [Candidatus Woesebacteria bacterium]|nr:hypothetical protein [Candidatus Woesebacteria bacterium]
MSLKQFLATTIHLLAYLALCICLFGLSACATGERMSRLRYGMTIEEVNKVMGQPDGTKTEGNRYTQVYFHRMVTSHSYDRADLFTIFENERLIEWGKGEIAIKTTPFFMVVPAAGGQ